MTIRQQIAPGVTITYLVDKPEIVNHHICAWPECQDKIYGLFACAPHWRQIPRKLQRKIWRAYEIGQEVDMSPSVEYLNVVDEVQEYIKEHLL